MHHSSDGWSFTSRWKDLACIVLLALAVILLFKSSPTQGDFWWSDAPRHAMDGVFYYELVRTLPLTHFKQWAIDYYIQYPAVTVLTYPPLFALVEAVFFSLFGVSHMTAQLTVSAFFLATAYGAYFLARCWVGHIAALSTALAFIGTPIMVLWGRQVMLEIPTFAFLLWSAYFFCRYLGSGRPRDLYLTAVLVLGAAYTKQPAIFIVAAYLLTLCLVYKKDILRRAEIWWSALLFAVGLTPLVVFTWLWGRANVQQAAGGGWVKVARLSQTTWEYVARYEWPRQLGWTLLVLATIYCLGAALRKQWRLPKPALIFLAAWMLTGYVFFTLIAVTSSRYTIFLVFPIVFFAILAIVRGLSGKTASYVALLFAVASFAYTLVTNHVPYVSGYRAAAQYVCSMASPNSVIMFSGMRDGSFIFNVRSMPECKNLTVIRSDKLLLNVAIDRRLFGVQELGISEAKFREMFERYGIRYIVAEPGFWTDLQSMQMLMRVLHEDQFKLLARIPVVSNRERKESPLEIYQNLGPASQEKNGLRVELPVSGIAIEGKVGQDK
jgi:4-amino-4-deoxy-L-arabinose transferase-like glycosyltransferase